MAPKAGVPAGDEGVSDIVTLCHLIMSCNEFKADNNKLVEVLDIKLAKNIPRKINSIVNRYGFDYKNGKIGLKDGDGAATAPTTPKSTATGANGDGAPKTPASKSKKVRAAPKTPASKKRKIQALAADDGDADVRDEVTADEATVEDEVEAED